MMRGARMLFLPFRIKLAEQIINTIKLYVV